MARKIQGRNAVRELLKTEKIVYEILIAEGVKRDSIKEIIDLANKKNIELNFLKRNQFENAKTISNPQGIIALTKDYEYSNLKNIIKDIDDGFVLICDSIKDPHNLGAILRTADATNVDCVIIPKDRAVDITPVVTNVSVGASEYVKVCKVTNIARTIDFLKDNGFWITGTDVEGTKTHFESDFKGNIGVVIGSESSGMRRLVKEKCDFLVKIPMLGQIESLNASVAASILMYEVLRQKNYEDK